VNTRGTKGEETKLLLNKKDRMNIKQNMGGGEEMNGVQEMSTECSYL